MWVARDKDNSLWFFTDKPKRNTYTWTSRSQTSQCEILMDLFTNLKWEDEPIEVSLIENKELELIKRQSEAWKDSFGNENEH